MVHLIPALKDNYIHAIRLPSHRWVIVDPSESRPVFDFLANHPNPVGYILNTHHHWDHVGGNADIQAATQAEIICSEYDLARIPSADRGVKGGDRFELDGEPVEVLAIPGHTLGHIAFYFPRLKSVFVGDTLFSMGCGRLFEGTPEQMQRSLASLCKLPDDTEVYCGHEYTAQNLEFAMHLDPHSHVLRSEMERVLHLRSLRQPSLPTRLDHEKSLNPFLRWQDPKLRARLDMLEASDAEVFATLRQMKNEF